MLRVIFVTAPPKRAEKLARQLVGERLAACANLIPGLTSLYWWKGKLERAGETLLILKTTPRQVRPLMRRVRELHPYEVPEILALPVAAAHKPYADWVARQTRRVSGCAGTRQVLRQRVASSSSKVRRL